MVDNSDYLPQLQAEKDNLDPSFVHALRLISQEIDRVESGGGKENTLTDVSKDKPVKLTEKVLIPIKEYPKFNFVGKLLGPKGNSLKRLQEETGTKMSILGRGSMRDKQKEEELRKEGGKYAHLNDELHLMIEVFSTASDAHNRMAVALGEVKKFLTPEYHDDIRAQQMQEMMQLNGDEYPAAPAARGRGRGGPAPRGRGGVPPGPLLATPPSRGGPSARGGAPGRGAPSSRGAIRGAPSGRGLSAYGGRGANGRVMRPPAPEPLMERYSEDPAYSASYDDGYGEQSGYSGYETAGGDTQYFDYGHGSGGREAYDDGYGDSWGSSAVSYGKSAPVARGKADYRSHPYSAPGSRGVARY